MKIDTMEKCPMCTGNGKIDSSLLLIETIENKIHNLIQTQKGEIKIAAHPFVTLILIKEYFSHLSDINGEKKFKGKSLLLEMKDYIYYNIV